MILVSIKKEDQITNQGQFPSMEEAETWLAKHQEMKTFGEPAIYQEQDVLISEAVTGEVQVLVSEAVLDQYGNEVTPALYTTDPDGIIVPAVYERQMVLVAPAQYSIEITDISSQIQQELTNKEALKLLSETDWKVIRHRDQLDLGIPTSLSEQEFQELLQLRQATRNLVS